MDFCKKTVIFSLVILFLGNSSFAQKDSIVLSNSYLKRVFTFEKGKNGFGTTQFLNVPVNENYIKDGNQEFAVTINNQEITGLNTQYYKHSIVKNKDETILRVELKTPIAQVNVILEYTVYLNLPFIRKQLQVVNLGTGDVVLNNLDVERLNMVVKATYMNEVYANYGTNMTRIPYKGDYNDAAIYLFNPVDNQGVMFGNEAPSVLKRTEIYVNPGRIAMGMGLINEPFPFKKFLATNETFKSPKTFISFTNHPKWQYAFEDKYQDFIRQKLGVKLYERKNKPFFIYNTWQPFFDKINAPLIKECADNLQNTGTDLFIIDAGWYKRAGDFNADPVKFPDGMKPVTQYIKSKGMQVGVWFTISSVHAQSQIAKEHPEWIVKDKNGKTANLHDDNTAETGEEWHSAIKTMSLGSPYYDHIKNVVRGYVNEWGISYLKLDLSIANSAYVNDFDRTGDYETNSSKLYKDRASSYWTIYERVMNLMDDLHQEFPDLLLDCTFEVWGRYNVVDYALVQHGDYDWLTNFDYAPPTGAIAIRQMAYDRARVVPASTLLIGNQFMDFPNYPYVYFSVAASSALMVGDPRKLTVTDKQFYNTWNAWFKKMEAKYQCAQYRQIYDVFDRPTDSNWDGVYKFNTEKQGGLLFFFKNNSSDNSRTFKIPCLNPQHTYVISYLDKIVGTYKGRDLIEKGLKVNIESKYSSMVYGIEKK